MYTMCSQNESFQERLQISDITSVVSDAAGTLGVVDELADRERRRRNIIVYNLPEKPDRVADYVTSTNTQPQFA